MKGGEDGERATDIDRDRPHRKLGNNADKSLKPEKWETVRGEVADQSHFKDKCI